MILPVPQVFDGHPLEGQLGRCRTPTTTTTLRLPLWHRIVQVHREPEVSYLDHALLGQPEGGGWIETFWRHNVKKMEQKSVLQNDPKPVRIGLL